MLNILVCHSYFLRFDHKQFERAKPYPPLATLQVASLLRSCGHSVALFDAMLADGVADFDAALREYKPQLVVLYEDNFNYLSKMCLGKMRRAATEMIAMSRRAGARVIAAGSDVSDAPEIYLQAGADVSLLGEGLPSLLAVVKRLAAANGAPVSQLIEGLAGVAAVVGGELVQPHHTDTLPAAGLELMPAWDLVQIDKYRAIWMKAHGYFSLNMATSRGCPFRCTWCAKPIWGNRYIQRTAESVAAEVNHLRNAFAVDHVWFADDIFGFRTDWVEAFASAMRAAGGPVPFTIQTRADLISDRMASALGASGCREVWIGAESGSQRVLNAMNKGTTVAEILTARERLRAAGIRVGFFIQLGYLDELLADILATRELLAAARPDDIGVSVAYPLPGTAFYELVKHQIRGKTNWQDSDDLAMMFEGTYQTEFYRAVRTLLHDQVALDAGEHHPGENFEASEAHSELQRRWHALIANEAAYRTATLQQAAAN
jgi:anaerobic magnesium-protoporphyrin IX monomethyl ester cyclase